MKVCQSCKLTLRTDKISRRLMTGTESNLNIALVKNYITQTSIALECVYHVGQQRIKRYLSLHNKDSAPIKIL